jgi:hypothetical protein
LGNRPARARFRFSFALRAANHSAPAKIWPGAAASALAEAIASPRRLVADQLAATAGGKERRTAHPTCALPQTLPPPPQRHHRNLLRSALALSRRGRQRRDLPQHAGKQPPRQMPVISGRCVPARCETGPSRRRWKHRRPKPAKTLQSEAIWSVKSLSAQ